MPQRLAQHLITRNLVPPAAVDSALRRVQQEGGTLDTALLEGGAISEAGMLQALSDVSGIRLVHLADFEPNAEAGPLMPLTIARQLSCVPLSLDGTALHIACSFPMPASQLEEAGFFLGRTFEVWVALECRIRDWQRVLYGQPLEPRFQRLLTRLDPTRPPPRDAQQVGMSDEVLERITRGIHDEPILLDRPKRKAAAGAAVLEVVPIGDDEPSTSVLDVTAYGRFAQTSSNASDEGPTLDEGDSTRVLDVSGYAAFAKQVTPAVTGPMSFPGGMLPPRPAVRVPPVPATPVLRASTGDESDFSDLDVAPSRAGLPPVPQAPQELLGASAREPPTQPHFRRGEPATRATDANQLADDGAWPPSFSSPSGVGQTAASRGRIAEPTTEAPAQAVFAQPSRPVASAPSAPTGHRLEAESRVVTEPYRAVAPAEQASGVVPPSFSSPSGVRQTVLAAARGRVSDTSSPVPSWSPPEPMRSVTEPPAQALALAPGAFATRASPVPSNAAEWTLSQARATLANTPPDRDQLIAVVLDYARRCFEYTCSFAVMRGAAFGWELRGEGDAAALREVAIPLDAASLFRTVALTRGSYAGPLPPDALTKHYVAQLGRLPRTVFLWPVEVQSRLVAILYGDCGARPVSQRRLSDFILFCQDLPAAFHQLILHRRTHPTAGGLPEHAAYLPPAPAIDSPVPAEAPTDAEWYQGLVSLLTGPDPTERSMAMLEFMKTPHLSAGALAQAFPGPTGWSRLPVVDLPEADELGPIPGALARLGEPGALALAPLLDSEDSDTRYLALLSSGSLRYPAVVDGVVRGLFDFEPDISSAARAAAAALRPLAQFQARLPSVRQALAAPDTLRRSLAARALGVLHDRLSVDALIDLTASDDALCATAAVEALKEITRQGLGPDTAGWSRWWAANHQRRRLDWLIEALVGFDFDVRLAAIEELSRAFGDTWGYFADGPPEERIRGAEAWRAFADARPEVDV